MKKINAKKIVLWGSIVALATTALLGVAEAKLNLDCSFKTNERMSGTWEQVPIGTPGRTIDGSVWVNEVVWDNAEWCEPLAFALMSFFPLLLLSLITYKMRDEVFHAWWNFARWWVPVIIITTLLLNKAGGGGGGMGGGGLPSGMLDFVVLVLLYAVFVIVSLVKIVRAYNKK